MKVSPMKNKSNKTKSTSDWLKSSSTSRKKKLAQSSRVETRGMKREFSGKSDHADYAFC